MRKAGMVRAGTVAGLGEQQRVLFFVVGVLMLMATSCATPMRVQSDPPGAEVTYQRQSYGPTPTTVPVEPGAYGSEVELTLKSETTTQKVRVVRQETDWKTLMGYVAIDTAVCCTCASAGIFFAPAFFAAPTAYLALPAQFWFFGVGVPQSVSVDMESGETDQRVAERAGEPPPDRQPVSFIF